MNTYDVPLGRCKERSCPVRFTSGKDGVCWWHHEEVTAAAMKRAAYLADVADTASRAPTETRHKGHVVRR